MSNLWLWTHTVCNRWNAVLISSNSSLLQNCFPLIQTTVLLMDHLFKVQVIVPSSMKTRFSATVHIATAWFMCQNSMPYTKFLSVFSNFSNVTSSTQTPKYLTGYISDDLIVIEILGLRSNLCKVGKFVAFWCITSYTLYPGNKTAHAAAKKDTVHDNIVLDPAPLMFMPFRVMLFFLVARQMGCMQNNSLWVVKLSILPVTFHNFLIGSLTPEVKIENHH